MNKTAKYDVYDSLWQGRVVVRCKECWRSMSRDGIVDNNGFFPYESYPHAHWCSESKS